jgi:tetraacyldisaccharide 4'-kinase
VLTRGYRSIEMDDGKAGNDSSRPVSDEVLVLESHLGDRVPIGVGKDRFHSGQELARKGVKWFVLDDGFQHLQLGRDADLVLIDDLDPFGSGMLLPAGRLREPISGLRRADAIVITRSSSDPELEQELRHYSSAPIFYATTQLTGITRVFPGEPRPATDSERHLKFLAFCGTGNPPAFFADLESWKLAVAGTISFPDHYRYNQRRINEIEDFAAERKAKALLCTEKDLLMLGGLKFSRFPVFVCRIAMRPTDSAGLWRALVDTIERREKRK